jgi:raffinose/stachyose/melibiose transport system substrate-binding protein
MIPRRLRLKSTIITIIVMMTMILAACAPAPAETKKITIWHSGTSEAQHQLIINSVNRYMQDNPNVKVEEVPVSADAIEAKIKAAVGADNAPDIFITWAGGRLYNYAKAGKIIDLTERMNKDGYKDRFMDAAISNVTFDDKIWAVPIENVSLALVLYDKDLFAKYNIQPPTTYDELLEVAETFKAEGIAPFALGNKFKWPGSMYYMYLALRLGGAETFINAANRTGGSFADPSFVKAGEMLQELVKNGYFNEGYNTLDTDAGETRQLLFAGKAAMFLNGTWELDIIKDENPEFYSHMGFFPFPAIEGGKGEANDVVGTIGDNFYSISANSKYPDEAFELIKYLIDDTSVAERVAAGKVPPLKNIDSKIAEPLQKGVTQLLNTSKHVQLWYDQYLPPEIAQVHLDLCQALFDLSITPQEMADQTEQAAKEYYGE